VSNLNRTSMVWPNVASTVGDWVNVTTSRSRDTRGAKDEPQMVARTFKSIPLESISAWPWLLAVTVRYSILTGETTTMQQSLSRLITVAAMSAIALAGCASTPTPAPVTSTVTATIKASDAEQAQLDQQKDEQDQRQQQLDARESAVSQQEQMVKLSKITGDGTYLVNKEVMPGTYRNSGESGCYWERLSGLSGTNSDIIANDNASGPAVVTIESSDVAFATKRCGEWDKID
jgi:hypothetical protein